ncbi:nucleotidyltransferase domain-containing protein [Pedobacter sp. BS3]|uniref:nucleotidyltransferase family protein n=1 Tax=Pedobacter sp. BS3 TaxID=2567937 RepID=UPI0011EF307B|nr:nucleotidyltransferase domain-containing protein [Pedobacter sp. BS3]TZF84887.1 nucleotidyltransferase domain-containing protein [Pedobacter sp. BS3]
MQKIIQSNLSQIRDLMQQHNVKKAYLFGSAANGTMQPDSDVDFIIRFTDDIDFTTYSNNYFSLLYSLQDLLKREVELVAEETITNPYFIESINRSKIPVL